MRTLLTISIMLISLTTWSQQFTDKITKEFILEKKSADNAIIIANINGNVTVTGYEGDKILLEVTKTVKAKTEARLQKGKDEITLGVIDNADTLIFFVKQGCSQFGKTPQAGKWNNQMRYKHGWGYQWNCNNNDCKEEYDYKMDFVLKIPSAMHVCAGTVNDGNVVVENIRGVVKAENINGSIRLDNLMRESEASTINGDVDFNYLKNPDQKCRFYSLNGDINALFPKGLAANLSFESFNGEFYTNIDQIVPLPVKVEKSNFKEGVKYKVNGNQYQIGKGGALLDFETFNGNVYLKEN